MAYTNNSKLTKDDLLKTLEMIDYNLNSKIKTTKYYLNLYTDVLQNPNQGDHKLLSNETILYSLERELLNEIKTPFPLYKNKLVPDNYKNEADYEIRDMLSTRQNSGEIDNIPPHHNHNFIKTSGISSFKHFIENSQGGIIHKPIIYLNTKASIVQDNTPLTIIKPVAYRKISSENKIFETIVIQPKENKKVKLKDKLPFLKEFNPLFMKKENIDKKLIRKFRKFLKAQFDRNFEGLDHSDIQFISNFINVYALPPMKYFEKNEEIEFKSFNKKYLTWLFSKSGISELYLDFIEGHGKYILKGLIDYYDLANSEEKGIMEKLTYYVQNMHVIYNK
jgi:hypothetical protein